MLLGSATLGSLALPGFNALTLKLRVAPLVCIILWFIYPKGKSS